jgi:hypothetical protein
MPFKGKNVLTVGCQGYAKKNIFQVQSGIPNMGGGQGTQECQKGMGHLMSAQIHLMLTSPLICLGPSGSLHEANFLGQWLSRFIKD